MPLLIETVPCLQDNYAYLAHDTSTSKTALVDVPEAGPISERLKQKGWTLSHILITHHHYDHVDGLDELLRTHPAKVIGHAADKERLPHLDIALNDGDTFQIGSETGTMLDVSGHTIGHVAYHFPGSAVAFTADSLMALGCGRVFEGTLPQMFASLQRLAAMPPNTLICSGHEYTSANGTFALTIDPNNSALISRIKDVNSKRAAGEATVPSMLYEELATNPYLRAHDVEIQKHLGLEGASPEKVFAEIRRRKDNF